MHWRWLCVTGCRPPPGSLQPPLVLAMLRDLKESSLNLLDEALRYAIVNNRVEIAISALELGASTAVYNVDAKKPDDVKVGEAAVSISVNKTSRSSSLRSSTQASLRLPTPSHAPLLTSS